MLVILLVMEGNNSGSANRYVLEVMYLLLVSSVLFTWGGTD